MRPLRAIMVDDEPLCRRDLHHALKEVGQVQVVGEAATLNSARQLIRAQSPDLIFLDLSLRQEKGFDLIRLEKFAGVIIAVTAYPEHAPTAFDLDLTDYLLKPVQKDRLRLAIQRAKRKLASARKDTSNQRFVADFSGAKKLVDPADIMRLESMGNYVVLHATMGKGVVRSALKNILKELPQDLFVQSARGCWVARDQISSWTRSNSHGLQLTLVDQSVVPVSRRNAARVARQLSGAKKF